MIRTKERVKAMGHLVTGLDIGTTKVTTIIASIQEDESVDVIGVGQVNSRGLERGMVVNLEETVYSIQESIQQAEYIADVKVDRAYVGIAGNHIRGINTSAVVSVASADNEITPEDVNRVMQTAQTMDIPPDLEIIHVFPQGYEVNGVDQVRNPVGLSGTRLEGEVYIVLASTTAVQNIKRAVSRAGVEVAEIVLQPLASSLAVLTGDEKELGVAMLDVGGGTTDIAVFTNGNIRHTAVVGLGGSNVTSDIAIVLPVPMVEARRLKHTFGYSLTSLVDEDQQIMPETGLGGRSAEPVSIQNLAEIIESRMEEIFQFAWREVQRAGLDRVLAGGVVLTGGGAMVKGAPDLARKVFGLPVKLGQPHGVGGLVNSVSSPMNATGIGLVLYGANQERLRGPSGDDGGSNEGSSPLGSAFKWMRNFLTG